MFSNFRAAGSCPQALKTQLLNDLAKIAANQANPWYVRFNRREIFGSNRKICWARTRCAIRIKLDVSLSIGYHRQVANRYAEFVELSYKSVNPTWMGVSMTLTAASALSMAATKESVAKSRRPCSTSSTC